MTAPVDPARFGITGGSLGGYTSWSGGLMSNAFATIVPFGWGVHFFVEGIQQSGSIDRITGEPRPRARRPTHSRLTPAPGAR